MSNDAVIEEPSIAASETSWYESAGVDPEILTDKDKEYKSLNDYIQATHNLRDISRSGVKIPGEDASEEDREAFKSVLREHLGDEVRPEAPSTPDEYDIELFKADGDIPEERVKEILTDFHERGFSNEMANAAAEIWAKNLSKDEEEVQSQIKESRKQAEEAAKQEWGDKYNDYMADIKNVEEKYKGLVEDMEASGITSHPEYLKLMNDLARATSEDGTTGGSSNSSASIDEQIKALRADPKFRKGNVFERREITAKLEELYKKKVY